MTKTFAALAAGLCAVVLSVGAFAATGDYKAAKKQAEADYKMAKAECKHLNGADKKACMKKAEKTHEATEDRLRAEKKQ